MKKTIISGITVFAATFLIPQIARAQGTVTFLSNLGQASTGSTLVGSDSWQGALFNTGSNPGGYALNTIQLAMTDASGNPSGFTVMLYSVPIPAAAVLPGSSLGTLTGSANPSTTGVYTFNAPADLTLSASTLYSIVITAGTTVANGAFNWSESAYPPGVNNGWGGVDNGILQSGNGTPPSWSYTPYSGIAQFAIYATPAPEPGVIGLFALGGLLLGFRRWKAKPV